MKLPFIKFMQENITMYMIKMSVNDIINNSVVSRYDSISDTNYQRAPIPAHYRKIAKYFMSNHNAILPTAILGAICSDDIRENDNKIEIKNKIRIVDGQHRIEGIKCLKEGYNKDSTERFNELNNTFEFPIILMVLEERDLMIEVDAFININSKGKKVRTDLAEALKSRKVNERMTSDKPEKITDDIIKSSSTNICRKMGQNRDSLWYGLIIQADENGKRQEQPISITAFTKAINAIVVSRFEKYENNSITEYQRKQEEESIEKELNEVWTIVMKVWPLCFGGINDMYNSYYNICKGMGVISLYGVYAECIRNGNNPRDMFFDYLVKSEVEDSDWLVGGRFTALSSGQGINKIKKYIMNEIESLE